MAIRTVFQVSVPMDTVQYSAMCERLLDVDTSYYYDGDSLVFDGLPSTSEAETLESKVVSWL